MATGAAVQNVARLMAAFRQGDKAAATRLVEIFYPELRRIAGSRMKRERGEHTWQPTALVSELYLELCKIKALRSGSDDDEAEKTAFLALATHLMKRLLIQHSRPLSKRVERVEVKDGPQTDVPALESLQDIETTLGRLAAINPKIRLVVEMRVFEGLTGDEIAARLGCAPVTVARYWSFAKRWLAEELGGPRSE